MLRSAQRASFSRFFQPRTGKIRHNPFMPTAKPYGARRAQARRALVEMGMRVQVRLTKKLAEIIDGIDLSDRRVGDVVDLPRHEAEILLAEGWASPVDSARGAGTHRTDADDRPRHSTNKRPR